MKLGDAVEVLGLVGTALSELKDADIKRAYRTRCMTWHPDTTSVAAIQAGPPNGLPTIDQLKAARDTLLNRRNVDEFACRTCKGTGSVRYRMGTRPCGACKGTGDGNGS